MPGRRTAAIAIAAVAATACGSPSVGISRVQSDSVLFIEARSSGYEPATIAAASSRPLVVDFTNVDPTSPHSVSIVAADGRTVLRGERTESGQTVRYTVGRLPAGAYTLRCDIFPGMTSLLSVVAG